MIRDRVSYRVVGAPVHALADDDWASGLRRCEFVEAPLGALEAVDESI